LGEQEREFEGLFFNPFSKRRTGFVSGFSALNETKFPPDHEELKKFRKRIKLQKIIENE